MHVLPIIALLVLSAEALLVPSQLQGGDIEKVFRIQKGSYAQHSAFGPSSVTFSPESKCISEADILKNCTFDWGQEMQVQVDYSQLTHPYQQDTTMHFFVQTEIDGLSAWSRFRECNDGTNARDDLITENERTQRNSAPSSFIQQVNPHRTPRHDRKVSGPRTQARPKVAADHDRVQRGTYMNWEIYCKACSDTSGETCTFELPTLCGRPLTQYVDDLDSSSLALISSTLKQLANDYGMPNSRADASPPAVNLNANSGSLTVGSIALPTCPVSVTDITPGSWNNGKGSMSASWDNQKFTFKATLPTYDAVSALSGKSILGFDISYPDSGVNRYLHKSKWILTANPAVVRSYTDVLADPKYKDYKVPADSI